MKKKVDMKAVHEDLVARFTGGFMCSETVVDVLNRQFELGMPDEVIAISTGFPYGFGNGGNVCGAVAGATMCLGKLFGRTVPGDPKFQKCLDVTRELNEEVIREYGTTICPELIKNYSFTDPERKTHCTNIVFATVDAFARIVERECGVELVW